MYEFCFFLNFIIFVYIHAYTYEFIALCRWYVKVMQIRHINTVRKFILSQRKTITYIRSPRYMEICELFDCYLKIFIFSWFLFLLFNIYSIYKSKDQADILDFTTKSTHTEVDVILKACAYIIEGLSKNLVIYPRWLV